MTQEVEAPAPPAGKVETKSLREAIALARDDCRYIRKIKKNGMQFFALREVDITRETRRVMGKYGLVMLTDRIELFGEQLRSETPTKDGGKAVNLQSAILVTYRIVHVSTGEETTVKALGNSCGAADKALLGAMTLAGKRARCDLLMIAAGEDPDGNETPLLITETAEEIATRKAAEEAKRKADEAAAEAAARAQFANRKKATEPPPAPAEAPKADPLSPEVFDIKNAPPKQDPPPPPADAKPPAPIADAALAALHQAIEVNFVTLETSPAKQAQALALYGKKTIAELDATQAKELADKQASVIAKRGKAAGKA